MGKENEITILNINRKEVATRLKELGAKSAGSHSYKRVEALLRGDSRGKHAWIRVRTDGNHTTITLKQISAGKFIPMEEYEIGVDNFVGAVRLLKKLIASRMLYFENERERYLLGGTSITIDKWPRIPVFLELEGRSMEQVRKVWQRLGVKGKNIGNVPIKRIYGEYGLSFRKVMGENSEKLKKILKE